MVEADLTGADSHGIFRLPQYVRRLRAKGSNPRPDITVEWMQGMFPDATDRIAAAAWSMATTGMGPSEYWGRWDVMADRVRVYGTKREARARDVPLIRSPAVPRLSKDNFRKQINKLTGGRVEPYDFRRTYSRWMERAGIVRARRKMYMGHAAGDVTGLYERHELEAYLVADARLIQVFIGMEVQAPAQLRKVD